MRGLNFDSGSVNLLGGGKGADQSVVPGSCRAVRSLRVLASTVMVAMMTMTAGRAAGQIIVGDPETGECLLPISYSADCKPVGSHGVLPTATPGGPVTCGVWFRHTGWNAMPVNISWLETRLTSTTRRLDRTPAVSLMFPQNGSEKWTPDNNPEGLRGWWRKEGQRPDGGPVLDEPIDYNQNVHPDQFEALVWQLENLYTNYGVRRFILWLPAGSYFGQLRFMNNSVNEPYYIGQDFSSNQWYGMPAWKREQFTSATGVFQQWRAAHPSAKFDLYMGAPLMDDVCTLHAHPASKTYPNEVPGQPPLPSEPRVRNLLIAGPNNTRVAADRWVVRNEYTTESRALDPRDQTHVDYMFTNLNPWIQCGIRTFWLDAGADRMCTNMTPAFDYRRPRWGMHEFAYASFLSDRGVRIGGENFPTVDDDGHNVDDCEVRQIPYLGLDSWLYSRNTPNGTVQDWRYQGNFARYMPPPDQTVADSEPHWWAAGAVSTFERLGEARYRGYVTSTYYNLYQWAGDIIDDASTLRKVQRWYSMGKITIADFNGDGIIGEAPGGAGSINGDDVFAFNHYWNNCNDDVTVGGTSRPFTVFAQGDVCGATFGSAPNGVIDMVDYLYWHQVYNRDLSNPQNPTKFDYGEADGL